jgi:hypothetical protein
MMSLAYTRRTRPKRSIPCHAPPDLDAPARARASPASTRVVAAPGPRRRPFRHRRSRHAGAFRDQPRGLGTHAAGQTAGSAPSLEINYAVAENVQLHFLVPLAFNHTSGDRTQWGIGDTELGIKYRFLDAKEDDWLPSAAVFPIIVAPTGDDDRSLGTGHTHAFLPLWLGKEFGDWTAFGGGGYGINPGNGNRNYLFLGVGITRKITEDLRLGAEIFRTSRTEDDGKDAIGFNLGASTTSATRTTS